MDRDELARLLGVVPGTIQHWARDGMPVAEGGGQGRQNRYRPSECVAWRMAALTAAAQAHGDGLNPQVERARKDRAQAALAEQMLKARERDLLPAAEVKVAYGRLIGATKAKLLAIPRAVAPELVQVATSAGAQGVERCLMERIRAALRELSGR
jgi:phage terminase Nu1 subunit (DNA packaging protein)